ncbi:hypothetical protein [Halorarius litoreus]|uniref:hypothetical protein n=1 Tax=Halorarius litoreus TaxID=2962676 RepID=UPI0020CF07EF|nr:hypothetical protein [Halorarius litoreus]
MGRIRLHDGTVTRTIPADGVNGVIEIDLGDEPMVTVPPGVEVRRSEAIRR